MKKTKLQTKKGFKKLSFEEAKVKLKRPKVSELFEGEQSSLYKTWKRAVKAKKVSLKRGSMTKPIPPQMREELAKDPFMKKCCLKGIGYFCDGDIQWHHALSYQGKRINEKGGILPVCRLHHEKEAQYRKILNQVMFDRMTDEDRAKYPKKKWL